MIRNKIIIDPAEVSDDLLLRLADEITNPRSLSVLGLSGKIPIQIHVVHNPETPLPLLNILAQRGSWEVRCEIAKQIRTPDETLYKLTNDTNFEVRLSARHTLKRKGKTC